MTDDPALKPYHHGDLRSALLVAAEAELADKGIEAFSLRQVAKRAGVSHAAPAHHFGDAGGLLTALAAEGYRALVTMQRGHEARAASDPRSQLIAAGLGYVAFARARPALFRLMFGSSRPDFAVPDLLASAGLAYQHLVEGVSACSPGANGQDIAGVWAVAHGLADLMAAGRLQPLSDLAPDAFEAALVRIIGRALP